MYPRVYKVWLLNALCIEWNRRIKCMKYSRTLFVVVLIIFVNNWSFFLFIDALNTSIMWQFAGLQNCNVAECLWLYRFSFLSDFILTIFVFGQDKFVWLEKRALKLFRIIIYMRIQWTHVNKYSKFLFTNTNSLT